MVTYFWIFWVGCTILIIVLYILTQHTLRLCNGKLVSCRLAKIFIHRFGFRVLLRQERLWGGISVNFRVLFLVSNFHLHHLFFEDLLQNILHYSDSHQRGLFPKRPSHFRVFPSCDRHLRLLVLLISSRVRQYHGHYHYRGRRTHRDGHSVRHHR